MLDANFFFSLCHKEYLDPVSAKILTDQGIKSKSMIMKRQRIALGFFADFCN